MGVNMAIYVSEIDNSTIVRFSRGNPSASSCRCHGFGIRFRERKISHAAIAEPRNREIGERAASLRGTLAPAHSDDVCGVSRTGNGLLDHNSCFDDTRPAHASIC